MFAIDSQRYPELTIKTEENNTKNQGSLFFIETAYPTSIMSDSKTVTVYIVEMLVVLSPMSLHPDKISIGSKMSMNLRVLPSISSSFGGFLLPHTKSHTFFKKALESHTKTFLKCGDFLLARYYYIREEQRFIKYNINSKMSQ